MKINGIVILVMVFTLSNIGEVFSQKKFTFINDTSYNLYGLKLKQNRQSSVWSQDIMSEREFLHGTSSTITIPSGYTCKTHFKVTYKDINGRIVEEIIGWVDTCAYNRVKITKNPKGTAGNWMSFVIVD